MRRSIVFVFLIVFAVSFAYTAIGSSTASKEYSDCEEVDDPSLSPFETKVCCTVHDHVEQTCYVECYVYDIFDPVPQDETN